MKRYLSILLISIFLIVLGVAVHAAKPKAHKHIFELKNVRVGDLVANMRILSMKPLLENIVLPPGVSLPPEHNIEIKFSGKATVTGTYHYYDDDRPFGLGGNVCIDELDKASLRKIPKLKTDGRGVWFCFTNQKQARKLFVKKGSSGKATIVIDKYVINSAETEVHNVATFVKRLWTSWEAFIPEGWAVLSRATGDLNKDGYQDTAIALEDKKHPIAERATQYVQVYPRRLMILLGTRDGYRIAASSDKALLLADEGGVRGDPLGDGSLTIKGSTLQMSYFGGSALMWASDYIWKHARGRWTLSVFRQGFARYGEIDPKDNYDCVNQYVFESRIYTNTCAGRKKESKKLNVSPSIYLEDFDISTFNAEAFVVQ